MLKEMLHLVFKIFYQGSLGGYTSDIWGSHVPKEILQQKKRESQKFTHNIKKLEPFTTVFPLEINRPF